LEIFDGVGLFDFIYSAYLVANSIGVILPAASAVLVAPLLRDVDPRSESMYINDSKPKSNPLQDTKLLDVFVFTINLADCT